MTQPPRGYSSQEYYLHLILATLQGNTQFGSALSYGENDALITIGWEHNNVHRGRTFVVSYQDDLNLNDTIDILIVPPTSEVHMHLSYLTRSTGEANFDLFEGTLVSANGTELTAHNRNRNSIYIAKSELYLTPTITNVGELLFEAHFGSGQNGGGAHDSSNEFELAPGRNYLFRITSEANGNDVSFVLDWYEA